MNANRHGARMNRRRRNDIATCFLPVASGSAANEIPADPVSRNV
jgi:hypothetical protein